MADNSEFSSSVLPLILSQLSLLASIYMFTTFPQLSPLSFSKKIYCSLFSNFSNMTIVEMRVHMDCAGCETKIRKSLQKLKGVDEIDIDLSLQKVTVLGWASKDKVLKTVRRTGRTAELWPYPYNPEYHSFVNLYQQSHYDRLPGDHQIHTFEAVPSSYNYRKHGYSGSDYGYYHQPPYSTLIDEKSEALFSDENPHACSIM